MPADRLAKHLKIKSRTGELVPLESVLSGEGGPDLSAERRALAELRGNLEAAARALEHEKAVSLPSLKAHIEAAKRQVAIDENAIDWKSLEQDDPVGWMKKREEIRERRAAIEAAETAHIVEQEKARQISEIRQQDALRHEIGALYEARPEWRDTATMQRVTSEIRNELKARGFTDEFIGQITDHRMFIAAHDLAELRRLRSGAAIEAKRVKDAPRLIKPEARGEDPDASPNRSRIEKLRRTHKRTGSPELAVELLMEMQ